VLSVARWACFHCSVIGAEFCMEATRFALADGEAMFDLIRFLLPLLPSWQLRARQCILAFSVSGFTRRFRCRHMTARSGWQTCL